MLNSTDKIALFNRSKNGMCAYSIPEMHITREFLPGETKKITFEELSNLITSVDGGDNLVRNYFIIQNKEAVEELLGTVEPEYYYTADDIKYLLTQGTMEQLEDCLNFAPAGVIDDVRDIAVEIKLNNTDKRKLIFEKTGYNVDAAIRNNELVEKAEAEMGLKKAEDAPKVRKAAVPTEAKVETAPEQPVRKAAPVSKYKVVE